MASVLLVDDEANIRRMLARLLEAEGYRTREAANGEAALAAVADEEPDLVMLDLAMPGPDGIQILERLRETAPSLPVVMMSGRATLGDAVRATKLGAFQFIEKPLAPEAVLLAVRGALELRRALELTHALAAELGGEPRLVGSSPAIARVRELIAQVAPTDARVLLTGESGTGKEVAAATLHSLSPRRRGPFIRVNSAAIPPALVESEMFGHERGAFSGADRPRRGRFELADGGTLFLDEVGDLGPEAQSKLLRALESNEIERVGSQRPIRVDVRVIAATNRDLEAEVEAGRFRRDLYYRLNVVPIHLPPLRERLEDIPELVAHLLDRLRRRHGMAPPHLEPAAIERLQEYPWPGNVRELANTLERLTILHAGRVVGARDVDAVLPRRDTDPQRGGTAIHVVRDAPLSEQLDQVERTLILAALEAAGGSVADAARRLRTDRANLYRRMKRLGIQS